MRLLSITEGSGKVKYMLSSIESRYQDHRYRKEDEGDVCKHIQEAGSEQLGVALSALWSRIGHDLPVVREWLARSKIANHGSKEGQGQEDM